MQNIFIFILDSERISNILVLLLRVLFLYLPSVRNFSTRYFTTVKKRQES